MHREPDVGFDPGSPGSRPGPKAGAKPLRHPGIPVCSYLVKNLYILMLFESKCIHIFQTQPTCPLENGEVGSLSGAVVWRLPLAQGAILETRDRIPCRAPGAWSLLLPLPVSPPLSLLSLIHI